MEKEYKNIITNKKTFYKYRFKTLEEFENEFSEEDDFDFDEAWRRRVKYTFTEEMDCFAGENFTLTGFEDFGDDKEILITRDYSGYMISSGMLIENKKIITIEDYTKKKNLVYENTTFKYYNTVTEEKTIYPYRFRTVEEFQNEYSKEDDGSDEWRERVYQSFIYEMDYLCGKDFLDSDIEIRSKFEIIANDYDNEWSISGAMVIENDKNKITINDYTKPKELVYEKLFINKYFNKIENESTKYPYRFKTMEEFKDIFSHPSDSEYNNEDGENDIWRDRVNGYFSRNMNYMCGRNYPDEYLNILDGESYYVDDYDNFTISTDMLIKNDISPLYNFTRPPKKSYENRTNESQNTLEEAVEICIKVYNEDDIETISKLVNEHKHVRFDYKDYFGDDDFLYLFIRLDDFSNSYIDKRKGLDYGIEKGEMKDNDTFDGVYNECFDIKKHLNIIKKMIRDKIVYSPILDFYFIKNRENVYENKINEDRNTLEDANSICIRVTSFEEMEKLAEIAILDNNLSKEDVLRYKSRIPVYLFYSTEGNYISWLGKEDGDKINIEDKKFDNIGYLGGVYNYVYNINTEYSTLRRIFDEKKVIKPVLYFNRTPKNVYESRNTAEEANEICIKIFNKSEIDKLGEIILKYYSDYGDLLDYKDYLENGRNEYIYVYVDFKGDNYASCCYLEQQDDRIYNIEDGGMVNDHVFDGVYNKIYTLRDDSHTIEEIFKSKTIKDNKFPYFNTRTNVYESLLYNPNFFSQTYYRFPNDKEIKEIDNYNLSSNEIINGLTYSIVGKGIMDENKKNMIIDSIKMLIEFNENNQEYIHALEKVQKII